jgi:hypothetical protein
VTYELDFGGYVVAGEKCPHPLFNDKPKASVFCAPAAAFGLPLNKDIPNRPRYSHWATCICHSLTLRVSLFNCKITRYSAKYAELPNAIEMEDR